MAEFVQRYPVRFVSVWLLVWALLWPLGHWGGDDEVTIWFVFLQLIITARLLEAIINGRARPAWQRYLGYVLGTLGLTAVAYVPTSIALNWFCGAVNPNTAVAGRLNSARLCYEDALEPSSLMPILIFTAFFLAAYTLYFGALGIWHWLR